MWLEYHFKDIMCEVEIDGGINEPNIIKKPCEVDYDYEVSISEEDIIDYIYGMQFYALNTEEVQNGIYSAIEEMNQNDFIDYKAIEDNKDFIIFMNEKYREKAHEKCVDENA